MYRNYIKRVGSEFLVYVNKLETEVERKIDGMLVSTWYYGVEVNKWDIWCACAIYTFYNNSNFLTAH
jgi:hypothetical protein